MLTRLGHSHQIRADTLELRTGHLDGGRVLGLGDTEMLLVDVHKLEVIFADAVVIDALEEQVERVWGILSLEGQDIVALGGAQNLCQRHQVDAESNVAVASVGAEGVSLEHHGDEGDMGVVHGLQRNARVIAVEVAVLHQVFDGIHHLLQQHSLLESGFQHDGGDVNELGNSRKRSKEAVQYCRTKQ